METSKPVQYIFLNGKKISLHTYDEQGRRVFFARCSQEITENDVRYLHNMNKFFFVPILDIKIHEIRGVWFAKWEVSKRACK